MNQPIVLPGTEVHTVHSDIMDFDFEISIQHPIADPGTPLPVVYATDANMGMGFTVDMTNMLILGG